jgi:protein gp37
MKMAGGRLQHHPSRAGLTQESANGPVWTGEVRFNEQWLMQPLQWKRSRRIFVCAHSDLFHESVPDEWIDRIFAVMGNAFCSMDSPHTFQVLTKRPSRMLAYLTDPETIYRVTVAMKAMKLGLPGENSPPAWPLPNVWLGVTAENQEAADERIPLLLQCPSVVHWISAEPLLGAIDLTGIASSVSGHIDALRGQAHVLRAIKPINRLAWVVCGGESGSGARPMESVWARELRDQCKAADIPFLFKQWGEFTPYRKDFAQYGSRPAMIMHGYAPATVLTKSGSMHRVGTNLAGRLLDGVQHDGYPSVGDLT